MTSNGCISRSSCVISVSTSLSNFMHVKVKTDTTVDSTKSAIFGDLPECLEFIITQTILHV